MCAINVRENLVYSLFPNNNYLTFFWISVKMDSENKDIGFLFQPERSISNRYPDNCPSEENCPPVTVGIWVKIRVSFRVGGNQTIVSEENWHLVRVRVWVMVSFGVGGRAIVLEPIQS